jgi:hypothetical protein
MIRSGRRSSGKGVNRIFKYLSQSSQRRRENIIPLRTLCLCAIIWFVVAFLLWCEPSAPSAYFADVWPGTPNDSNIDQSGRPISGIQSLQELLGGVPASTRLRRLVASGAIVESG